MSYRFNRRRALFNHDVLAQPTSPPPPAPASNAAFQGPADGWHHVVPVGEFFHADTGLVQVLDAEAIAALAAQFEAEAQAPNFAGVLVDFDHFSYSPGQSSQAAGWIARVEPRADGLWARIRWTGLGEAALANGAYRFISPVWLRADTEALGPGRVRPRRLDSAGLTNNPNLKGMAPLTNRSAGAAPIATPNPEHMKQLATLMGLPADASEDAVRAEITTLKNRATTAEHALQEARGAEAPLKRRLAELEGRVQALTETVAEADLNAYAGRYKPEARDQWKAQLIANRAVALQLLESLPAPAAAPGANAPVLNRVNGRTPPPTSDFAAQVAAQLAAGAESKSHAIDRAIATNPAAYQEWLAAGGGSI